MKKIAAQDLKVGMYVVDTGLDWTEHPYLYSQEGVIRSWNQIATLLADGFTEAFVDPARSEDSQSSGKGDLDKAMSKALTKGWPSRDRQNEVDLREEMQVARKVYKDSINFAKDLMADARMGSQVDMGKSKDLVGEFINSVSRNADALVSLSKLRSFDEYTFTHSINVSVLGVALGKHLGLDRSTLEQLGMAGLYHDVGKALIPPEILNKPGKLTDEEFRVMKEHPDRGLGFLGRQVTDETILRGIGEHHEKHNGKGYPKGLKGEEIAPQARILSVVDVYDALTSERVYKKGMMPSKALKIMYSMRGEDFFPGMIEQLVKCLGIYPVGSFVQLSTGEYGIVSESNSDAPLFPTVLVAFDYKMNPKPAQTLDLGSLDNQALSDDDRDKVTVKECLDPEPLKIDPAKYLL
ncbi:MAG: HD-GYP domain-containing protein [Desulfovibrio sp.]|nr:MAG: HD-GYP domain-containing protein [Desulfovibrio sp.]